MTIAFDASGFLTVEQDTRRVKNESPCHKGSRLPTIASTPLHFSPALAVVAAAILTLAAPVVSAEGGRVIAPDKTTTTEKEPKTTSSPEELLKIIEKQDALIKALRARIKELEQASPASPSPTPGKP